MGQVAKMKPSVTGSAQFRRIVLYHWKTAGRHTLPWRKTKNPYRILVSEIMLQQTQVSRVIPKCRTFCTRFPDFAALSRATPRAVLAAWQGLGYNRRALHLRKLAEIIVTNYRGRLPDDPAILQTLPGIGNATAGAIAAFAFNRPVVFIETNIRRVFIHFFFPSAKNVSDAKILPLVTRTLDRKNPREWYWALMDYGAMLGERLSENPNIRSARYRQQSPFKGSRRELRGKILKLLLKNRGISETELSKRIGAPPQKIRKALKELSREGFIRKTGATFRIT